MAAESSAWAGFAQYEAEGLRNATMSESAQLTRSLSLFKALERLGMLRHRQELHVLILGADYVEARNPAAQFAPLLRLLGNCGISSLRLDFIGPNLDSSIDTTCREIDGSSLCSSNRDEETDLPRMMVSFHSGTFGGGEDREDVDIIVCFHPGFWGYESWQTTIRALPRDVPCVATSYNKEEAEDDHDAILEAIKGAKGIEIKWLWQYEANCFASRVERESGIDGRPCIENSFWQAFAVTSKANTNTAQPRNR